MGRQYKMIHYWTSPPECPEYERDLDDMATLFHEGVITKEEFDEWLKNPTPLDQGPDELPEPREHEGD